MINMNAEIKDTIDSTDTTDSKETKSKIHWADIVATSVLETSNVHTVATGITPSGHIHIGNMREVVTADLVYRALVDKGAKANLIYIADTFDPLRKVYPFLDNSYEQHVGAPLSEIPCPCGKCDNYADHFLKPFFKSLKKLDIAPTVYYADRLYKEGKYTEAIKTALIKRDEIAAILSEVSDRAIAKDWNPFNPICSACHKINTAKVTGFDLDAETVDYSCPCGNSGTVPMAGGGKLTWRVDWPARWPILGITVEPFGKDHASAGGSYDTGKRIAREIYGCEPPHPIVYEWINLKGQGAMSSSTGVVVSIADMLEVVQPEVLRYLISKTKPERHIEFDPGMPVVSLVDEYDHVEQEEGVEHRAYELSQTSTSAPTVVPFGHMVTSYQIAMGNMDVLMDVLKRSGYDVSDKHAILVRAENVGNWLEKYAPPFMKFKVQEKLPAQVATFNDEQRAALGVLAEVMEHDWTALDLHNEVYIVAQRCGINGNKLFQTIYQTILGAKSGPRVGYFLLTLDRKFVIKRFKDAAGI